MPRSTVFSRRLAALGGAVALAVGTVAFAPRPAPKEPVCAKDNGGLVLAPGLCATLFAADIGAPRHVVAAPNGDLFVALYGKGGGVLALRDTSGDGVADLSRRFGPGSGNGIAMGGGYLYFATDTQVVRWKMTPGQLKPTSPMETIVTGLPVDGNHVSKSVALLGDQLIVNVGSATNTCQEEDRATKSPGREPCVELETRAGLWRFSASKPNQRQADGVRYATGIRNAVALAVRPGSNVVFAAQHGRDQLAQNWGFSAEKNAENPAEEFLRVQEGDDFGWPRCYFDNDLKSKVLSPEYGGDGSKTGACAQAKQPVRAFPGHWAPNAIAFAKPGALGASFGDGAFIAFHGSWNRAPLPQAGYRVVFQPLTKDGTAAGDYVTVATLKGAETGLRAAGVAVDPTGALFIAADRNGKVWRVVRKS